MPTQKGDKYCLICQSNHYLFDSFGNIHSKNIIGSSFRENNVCPSCLSFDRYRLMFYYLIFKENFLFNRNKKVLYIAPEFQILEVISNNKSSMIVTGDLKITNVDCLFNVEELCFVSNCFDYVICNHVLSHVDNEKKGLDEMYRVLKKGGKLILTVPINQSITNSIDSRQIEESKRLSVTGSVDHRRAYGTNFKNELSISRFDKVSHYNFYEENGRELCCTYCIDRNEDIFIASK